MAVTYRDCLAGECPCARPAQPDPGHTCPPSGLSIEADEAARYQPHLDEYADAAVLNRLEGITP